MELSFKERLKEQLGSYTFPDLEENSEGELCSLLLYEIRYNPNRQGVRMIYGNLIPEILEKCRKEIIMIY